MITLYSESILLNIEKVLGNENIEKLSPTDLWLLLHVAYFHDFGMVVLESKIHDFWTSPDFQNFLEEQYKGNDESLKRQQKQYYLMIRTSSISKTVGH